MAFAIAGCTVEQQQAINNALNSVFTFFDEVIAAYDKVDSTKTGGGYQPTPIAEVDGIPDTVIAAPSGALSRGVNLSDRVPPAGDQGGQGSCASWAAAYGMASAVAQERKQWGLHTAEHFASPRSLYAQVLASHGTSDCERGANGRDVMEPLVNNGAGSLVQVPYTDESCGPAELPAGASDFRLDGYSDINPPDDPQAIKNELARGSVVMWGAYIFDDLQSFKGDRIYGGSGTFLKSGEQHAGHMMLIVGYDDDRAAFRVLNSWGPDWGDGGYVWLTYDAYVTMSTKDADGTYRGEAWVARSAAASGQKPGAAEGMLSGSQVVDYRGHIALVFSTRFSEPLTLRTLAVTDPFGRVAEQKLNVSMRRGHVHFDRHDGAQWQPGDYGVVLGVTRRDGSLLTLSERVTVGTVADGPTAHVVAATRLPFAGFAPGVRDASARPARLR